MRQSRYRNAYQTSTEKEEKKYFGLNAINVHWPIQNSMGSQRYRHPDVIALDTTWLRSKKMPYSYFQLVHVSIWHARGD